MKFKMRVLHFSPDGNAEAIGEAISRSQKCNCDKIPPAYPIENEKLTFIGVEVKGSSVNKAVTALLLDMNPTRTKNVAFYLVGGNEGALSEAKGVLAQKEINVAGVHVCTPSGGGLFKKKITDSDVKAVVDWAAKIVDSM